MLYKGVIPVEGERWRVWLPLLSSVLLLLTFLRSSAGAFWNFGKCPGIYLLSVMRSGVLIGGLLFLLVSYIRGGHFYGWDQDLYGNKTSAAEKSLFMALRYTARNLLNLKINYCLANDTYDLCHNVGILQTPRYIHRTSRRRFTHSSSDCGIIVLFNQSLKITPIVISKFLSFECLVLTVSKPFNTVIATIYRPPRAN